MENPAFWFGIVIGMVLQTILYLCHLQITKNQITIISSENEEEHVDPADWWKGRQ